MGFGAGYGRSVVSGLLAASGLLSIAAARERWWPACPWGGFEAPDCLRVQSHAYDYELVSDPWIEIGRAAEFQAVALALLAAAVVLLPWLWLNRPVALIQLVTGATTASMLALAGATWVSAARGHAVELPYVGQVAGWTWLLVWPLALFVAMVLPYSGGWSWGAGWRALFFALMLASTPLVLLFFGPLFTNYLSYDSTPWTEAVGGGFLVAASLVLWPATRRVTRASSPRMPDPSALLGPARTSARSTPASR